jgi:glycosyltransferase involved in cell wall biosynthesis
MIAIVTPVGHEPGIAEHHKELRRYANGATVYYVVDSATDGATLRALKEAIGHEANTHLVRGPGGIAYAYLAGYFTARRDGCCALVELDVGHDPGLVPLFLHAIDSGADFVAGVRWGVRGASYDSDHPWRWALSRGGSALIGAAVGDHRLTDWTSGFHAMTDDCLDAVLRAVSERMPPGRWWQTAVRVAALRFARMIHTVPLSYTPTGRVPLNDVVASLRETWRLYLDGP